MITDNIFFATLQIYSQYVEVSDALQQEKDENVRLKQYLDQILKVKMHSYFLGITSRCYF